MTYAVAALLPLGVIAWLMRLWTLDLTVPFLYGGDALSTQAGVKNLLETGSIYVNRLLGAPGVSELYEVPGADLFHLLTLRLFGLLGAGWATAINVFYLSSYAAVGVAAVFVMRRLGASRIVSAAVAVLYSMLPYHWMRGEGHLFLASYWIVPLVLLVAVWMDSAEPPLVKRGTAGRSPFDLRRPRSIAALAICAVAATCGVYYAFFGCFFIVVAGVRAVVRDREWRVAYAAVLLVAVVALVAVLQVTPSIVYMRQHGRNPHGLVRNAGAGEIYGLRITQMFLPIDGHRVPVMAKLRTLYRDGLRQFGPSLDNESNIAALGVVGALGFLLSVFVFLFGAARGSRRRVESEGRAGQPLLPLFGMLNLAALLLATAGGFGAMLVASLLPQIRSYNRISVFVAFLALATLGVLADRLLARRATIAWRIVGVAAVAAVVLIGVLDQTPADLSAGPAAVRTAFAADAVWVRQVEGTLSPGAAVYQLPYMPYPEPGGPFFGMQDYDPLRGYVHAAGLRWSYGAIKGRADDAWQKATAALPVAEMVREVRAKGFTGIWVQLNGYEDGGAAITRDLTEELSGEPLRSADGVFAFWAL
jgi:phosphoglycerol transferase